MSQNSQMTGNHTIGCWSSHWDTFLSEHGPWWARVSSGRHVVYPLTPCLIATLSETSEARRDRNAQLEPRQNVRGRRGPGACLDSTDAEAELSFAQVCSTNSETVAVRPDGTPVRYHLWSDFEEELLCAECRRALPTDTAPPDRDMGSSPDDRDRVAQQFMDDMCERFESREIAIRRNSLRYAGWLIQQPDYQDGIATLRRRWMELANPLPFDMITGRLFSLPGIGDYVNYLAAESRPVREFLLDIIEFAVKWSLIGFASWELPIPQRPLHGLPADLIYGLRGPSAVVSHSPVYLNETSLHSVRTPFAADRRLEAELTGFPGNNPQKSLTERSLVSDPETVMRMYILETAVCQRVPENTKGLVARILDAFVNHFGCAERHGKRLRGGYSRSL